MTQNVSSSTRNDASNITQNSAHFKCSQLALVYLTFRQWTGKVAMHKDDYQVGTDGDIPDDVVAANYGQKKVIDSEHLKIFNNLKTKAITVLDEVGLPFCRGIVIPLDRAKDVTDKIRLIAEEYNRNRDDLVANIALYRQEWIDANPSNAKILQTIPCPSDLSTRINADFSVFAFSPVASTVDSSATAERDVEGLFEEIIKDVSQRSELLYRRSLLGKSENDLTQRTLNPLKTMKDKLTGLSFLNSGVTPLIDLISRLLQAMPQKGRTKFTVEQYNQLCSGLSVLSNAQMLHDIASGKLSIDSFIQNSFGSASIVSQPEPTSVASAPAVAIDEEPLLVSEIQQQITTDPVDIDKLSSEPEDSIDIDASSDVDDKTLPLFDMDAMDAALQECFAESNDSKKEEIAETNLPPAPEEGAMMMSGF